MNPDKWHNNDFAHNEAQQFRLLLENLTDYALLVLDLQGNIVTWNVGAERILGYTEQEAIGLSFRAIFTDEDRGNHIPENELSLASATGRADDTRWHQRKDGSRFWADGVTISLRDEQNTLQGFMKILRDRTEQKRLEDALQKEYERERRIAHALQQSLLLAPSLSRLRGLDVEAFYEPAWAEALVGGDFYDAFMIDQTRIALVVGDASGKGIDAAARTAEVKYAVRAFLNEHSFPARALSQVNHFLCEKQKHNPEAQEAFVSLALVVVDSQGGELLVSLAGSEPPLLLRGGSDFRAIPLEAPGIPLGIDPDAEYKTITVHMQAQDTLIVTTDGITEARKGRELLGYDGLIQLAEAIYQDTYGTRAQIEPGQLRELGKAILEGARQFGGDGFRDDVCLLVARLR